MPCSLRRGVRVPMSDLFGVAGSRLLDQLRLGRSRRCRNADRVRVPGAQWVPGGPLGRDRRRRDRVDQRHLAIWWMPYDPIWSLTYVAIGALVICALAADGGNAEAA